MSTVTDSPSERTDQDWVAGDILKLFRERKGEALQAFHLVESGRILAVEDRENGWMLIALPDVTLSQSFLGGGTQWIYEVWKEYPETGTESCLIMIIGNRTVAELDHPQTVLKFAKDWVALVDGEDCFLEEPRPVDPTVFKEAAIGMYEEPVCHKLADLTVQADPDGAAVELCWYAPELGAPNPVILRLEPQDAEALGCQMVAKAAAARFFTDYCDDLEMAAGGEELNRQQVVVPIAAFLGNRYPAEDDALALEDEMLRQQAADDRLKEEEQRNAMPRPGDPEVEDPAFDLLK